MGAGQRHFPDSIGWWIMPTGAAGLQELGKIRGRRRWWFLFSVWIDDRWSDPSRERLDLKRSHCWRGRQRWRWRCRHLHSVHYRLMLAFPGDNVIFWVCQLLRLAVHLDSVLSTQVVPDCCRHQNDAAPKLSGSLGVTMALVARPLSDCLKRLRETLV